MVKRLKKILHEDKEDLQYLLLVGLPTVVLVIILNHFIHFKEVY